MLEPSDSIGPVSPDRALTLGAVYRAIRLFSETPGAFPLIPYKRLPDESRERATSHSSYELLHDRPNPGQDAVTFWTLFFNHLASWGKGFIGKEFVGNRVVALHILDPWRVRVERLADGSLLFHENRAGGGSRTWTQRDLLYVMLFTTNGYTGLSPIGLARETLKLGLAMRKHGVNTFDEAAVPAGALQTDQEIKDKDVRDRMRKEWKERHQGRRDIAILDAGAKFETYSMPFEDLQFVELAASNRTDIADFFNMPASLLGGKTGDSWTYGNRQDDMQQFLTFTLQNPLSKVEQALSNDRDLFPQVNTYFCEFLRDSLLQPNTQARATYYRLALDPNTGWMQRSEVRARENLPTEPDEVPSPSPSRATPDDIPK
jgi:HK97 family phage portal protein